MINHVAVLLYLTCIVGIIKISSKALLLLFSIYYGISIKLI